MFPIIFAAVLTHHIVKADQPFEAAALSWNANSEVAVRLRVSDDGSQWSEWTSLAIDDDSSDPSAGRYVTAIAHFGSVKHYIEYAIDGAADRVTVTVFPAAPPPAEHRIAADSFPFGPLTIRARSDWGCP